jgi:hypothetical protein
LSFPWRDLKKPADDGPRFPVHMPRSKWAGSDPGQWWDFEFRWSDCQHHLYVDDVRASAAQERPSHHLTGYAKLRTSSDSGHIMIRKQMSTLSPTRKLSRSTFVPRSPLASQQTKPSDFLPFILLEGAAIAVSDKNIVTEERLKRSLPCQGMSSEVIST